jgi:potassium-transporting ATPase KdpC subunit
MRKTLFISLRTTFVTLLVTGIAYPLAMTGVARALVPDASSGSLVRDESGKVVGSSLIGQRFNNRAYFQPRPSAAGTDGYDAMSSSGSNLGPTSAKLRDRVTAEVERLRKENPDATGPIPVELVTASGSGLDPDLSPNAARFQVERVARARKVSPERVAAILGENVEGRELLFLGEPRVNVLRINMALDRRFGPPAPLPSSSSSPAAQK